MCSVLLQAASGWLLGTQRPWNSERCALFQTRTQTTSLGGWLYAHWSRPHPACGHRVLLLRILTCICWASPAIFSKGCLESCLTKATRWRSVDRRPWFLALRLSSWGSSVIDQDSPKRFLGTSENTGPIPESLVWSSWLSSWNLPLLESCFFVFWIGKFEFSWFKNLCMEGYIEKNPLLPSKYSLLLVTCESI